MKMADMYVSIYVRGTVSAHRVDGSRSMLLSDDGIEFAHLHFAKLDQAKQFADAINAAAGGVEVRVDTPEAAE